MSNQLASTLSVDDKTSIRQLIQSEITPDISVAECKNKILSAAGLLLLLKDTDFMIEIMQSSPIMATAVIYKIAYEHFMGYITHDMSFWVNYIHELHAIEYTNPAPFSEISVFNSDFPITTNDIITVAQIQSVADTNYLNGMRAGQGAH